MTPAQTKETLEVLERLAGFQVLNNRERGTWDGTLTLDGQIYGRALEKRSSDWKKAVETMIPAALSMIQDATLEEGPELAAVRKALRAIDPDPLDRLLVAALEVIGVYVVVVPFHQGPSHRLALARCEEVAVEKLSRGFALGNGSRILIVLERSGSHQVAGLADLKAFVLVGARPDCDLVSELVHRARIEQAEWIR